VSGEWLQRNPDPVEGPWTELNIHGILRPWWRPRRSLFADLDRTAQAFRELGNLEFFYYGRFLRIVHGAHAGERIEQVDRRLGDLCGLIERSGAQYREPRILARPYRLLRSTEVSEQLLLEELAASDREIASTPGNSATYTRTSWALVLGVCGRWDLAFAQTQAVDERRFGGYSHLVNFTLYRAVAASVLAQLAGEHRRRHRRILRRGRRRMRGWARRNPDFEHMALWLEAELQQLRVAHRAAVRLYQQAASAALEREHPHDAALCLERLGHLLHTTRRASEALLALTQAINHYRSWGATAKGAALEQEVTELGLWRRSAPHPSREGSAQRPGESDDGGVEPAPGGAHGADRRHPRG